MSDLAAQTRVAYAAGWALSGGPLTPRIQAGCAAAVAAALEVGHPGVLETTLQIGKLEGTWAAYFDRREKLIAAQIAAVLAAWLAITADLHPRAEVRRLMAELGPAPDPALARQLAVVAAAGLLSGVYAHDRHHALQTAVLAALTAAAAEGQTGALALAADHAGRPFAWDAAFSALSAGLAKVPDLIAAAQQWIQRMITGAASSIGSLIGRLLADGATGAEIEAAVTAALGAGEAAAASRAVGLYLDQAMTQAMSQAALTLYQMEGVGLVYFVTAGDAAVCVICQGYEDGNPYNPADVPTPGVHPNCVPGDVLVSAAGGVRAGYRRWYKGELVVIHTAGGKELPVTPNHPVATPEGWVAAGDLQVGQRVLCDRGRVEPVSVPVVSPDDQLIPARISDVLDALRQSCAVASVSVPAAAEQFHGDGEGSDVEVVLADGLLQPDVDAVGGQREADGALVASRAGLVGLPGERALFELGLCARHAADGVMGGAGQPGTLLRARPGHAGDHRLAETPALDPGAQERGPDRRPADAEGFCQSLLAIAAGVTADEVVEIGRHPFSGHVYNLDTGHGWYFANSIVTHNCRCTITPADPLPYAALADYLP